MKYSLGGHIDGEGRLITTYVSQDASPSPILAGTVPNSVVLMFVRGWQGGTVHQIARELDTTADDIESADLRRMGELMRIAQMKLAAQGRAEAMGHGLTAPMPRELPNAGRFGGMNARYPR